MRAIAVVFLFFIPSLLWSQKNITQQFQVWVSANNSYWFSQKWAVLGDVHIRRNNGLKDPSFYFLRGGLQYKLGSKVSLAGGYAHMWIAPSKEGYNTFANENRLWQQLAISDQFAGTNLLFRVRNEQRKTEIIAADTFTGNYRTVNRVRVLCNFLLPVFDEAKNWQLLIADEFLFNLGKQVTVNTFDQNRFIIGVRKKINQHWSYDLGYMMVYQQLGTGTDYNLNHTLRLFFYGNFKGKKLEKAAEHANPGEE